MTLTVGVMRRRDLLAAWGEGTCEMQKRYLPDGSCGMRRRTRTCNRASRPNRSPTSSPIRRSLAAVKSAAADDAEQEPANLFLHDLNLRDAGHENGEVLGQRDAGDQLAGGGDDVVGLAALERFQQRQPAAARANTIREHADVADLVADQRHREVAQIGDDDRSRLARRAGRPSATVSTSTLSALTCSPRCSEHSQAIRLTSSQP